jgi:4-nitrophenyl phosphatase
VKKKQLLRPIQALVIDIDGTLWRGDTPLPGLFEFFDFLHEHRLKYAIVTNNTVKTPAQYRERLAGFGVVVEPGTILTAATGTADYLTQHFAREDPVYVIGEVGLRRAIQKAGFTILEDASRAAAVVVVGGDSLLTYAKLKYAVLHIQRGAVFVGSNPDLLIPSEEGLIPEAGTTLAAIQAATNVSPTVVGKPEPILFDLALAKMGTSAAQTTILGDRLDTDIVGGQRAGLKTILVTTGVDNETTTSQKGVWPDAVFADLTELVATWQTCWK